MTLVYVVDDIHGNTALLQSVMGESDDVVKIRSEGKKGKEKQRYILLEVKANTERYNALRTLLDAIPEVANAYLCQQLELDNNEFDEDWPRITQGSFSQEMLSGTAAPIWPVELPVELTELWPRVTQGSFWVKYVEEPARQMSSEWPRVTLGSVVDVSTTAVKVMVESEQRDAQLASMLEVWPRITQASVV